MRHCGCATARLGHTDLVVLEYEQLKEEQRLRITSRDNLIYATLVAVGAVCGAALQVASPTMLLLLPAICAILGWTYVSNDRKVSQIGRHIRQTLTHRLPPSADPFAWESVHRTAAGYRLHRGIQTAVTLLTFCGPGTAAIMANWTTAASSPPTLTLIAVEAAGTAVLAQQVLTNPDARPHR